MQVLFPAHIHPDDKTVVQTCTEHARNTAQYAGQALNSINLYSSAYLAGLLHDCGKYKMEYKKYLEASTSGENVRRGSVIHTFAGVRYLLKFHMKNPERFEDLVSEILAYAVGAHHGLFDCVNESHESGFLHRIETIPEGDREAIHNFHEQCANEKEVDRLFENSVKELKPILEKCNDTAKDDDESAFLLGLVVRLITSAVMEGDRRDTAEFMNSAVFPAEANREVWHGLLEKTEVKLNTLSADTPINAARRRISDICRNAADKPSGIYRLNVPTGGGKTLSALRYALAHAAAYNKKRIIFTSPLLSILEQNSSVIREYVGDDYVLEHHSNAVQEKDSLEELERYELLAESWSSPIIITTLVQLLNTMFDGKTSSVRRFHALTDAVIVIDEIQTVPEKLLTLFNLTISFLAELCNTTILLCSATQPCLESVKHPVLKEIGDIVPHNPELWEVFKRTEISFAGAYRINEIPVFASEVLENTSSLLIVCNKKAESESIFDAMQNSEYDVFHLSAAMCMEHRRETLDNLQKSLECRNRKTVCVATQVIEAGVDISFGAVIRLTAGMDSIIQSAGRCNRNGESDDTGPVYIVRAADEKMNHLHDIQLAQQATEQLLAVYKMSPERYGSDLASDEAIRYYYKQLFRIRRDDGEFCHDYPVDKNNTLFSLLSENRKWQRYDKNASMFFAFNQAFASAGKLFEVFDSDTTDVIVPWGEGENIITDLSSERAKHDMGYAMSLLNRAKSYTVSLYSYQKKKLEEYGVIHPLLGGSVLSLDAQYYDYCTGVKLNDAKEVHNECDIQIW